MIRSDLVFEALHTLRNRYMLCQLASKATRKFHRPNTRIQETMNQVLERIGDADREQVLAEPEKVAEAQRRAA
jgi:GTP cyclohydrolase I